MKDIKFKMEFRGTGFSKKIDDPNEQFNEPPRQKIITEITGPGKYLNQLY
jgi:hypothetical protein